MNYLSIARPPSGFGIPISLSARYISISSTLYKSRSGRFRVSIKNDKPLTYEESQKPHFIAHRKAWNSYNTSSFPEYGLRKSETSIEDMFIRRFMTGTWHNLFVSEIIIKRQNNLIRIAGIVQRAVTARKMYFLIGYSEELLSYWLQCPIKLELQTVDDKKDMIFKYV